MKTNRALTSSYRDPALKGTLVINHDIFARLQRVVFLLLLISFIYPFDAASQNYLPVARYLGVEDGLPHRQVNCIIQDRKGFIWVATNGGVARYDGARFKIFNKADNGLTTDIIDWLLEDGNGSIWLISKDNPDRYPGIRSVDILEPVTGMVSSINNYIPGKLPLPLLNINYKGISFINPVNHQQGTLVFGTMNPGGWISWHPTSGWKQQEVGKISALTVLAVTPQNGTLGYYDDELDLHIIETDQHGKVLHDYQAAERNRFDVMNAGVSVIPVVTVKEFDKSLKGKPIYWEIKPGGGKTRLEVSFPHYTNPIWNQQVLLKLDNANLWFTETQVFTKDGKLQLDLLAQFPFFNNRADDICFVDRKGGIWLGTVYGLEIIEIRKDLFQRFLFDENAITGGGIACRGIQQNEKHLWVNTEGGKGLFAINLETGEMKHSQQVTWNYALTFDRKGSLWSGQNLYAKLESILVSSNPVSLIATDSFSFQNNNPAWSIYESESNKLWLGLQQGILFLDPVNRTILEPGYSHFPELKTATVIQVKAGKKGFVWLCTTAGLYKLTAAGEIKERYWTGGGKTSYLPFDNFYHIYEDNDGIIWLGTAGAGLLRWNPATGEKQLFSRKSGLLNGYVYAVYEDDFEHLWLPTDYGMAQFDKKTLTVRRTWLSSDGLAQNEFNRISHFKAADGTLYFGGLNGVTSFNPKNFYGAVPTETTQQTEDLVVSDLKKFSVNSGKLENETAALLATRQKNTTETGSDGEIILHPSDRYFQLEFAFLDYFSPKGVSYAYKIDGLDEDWNTLPEPQLRLASLPFGKHLLKIRAQTSNGTWAKNELRFSVLVLRPYYLRWWFVMLVAGLLVAGSFYFYRFQLRRRMAEKETQRLQQLDTFKTRFFTNISHEFRTPITVILGMLDFLKQKSGNPTVPEPDPTIEMIRRNGQQLLNLVNQLLDLSRLEAGKLKLAPANGDIVTFLLYQVEAFQSYAQSRNTTLQYHTSLPHLKMAFDHQKVQTILVNLVANALKFTPSGGSVNVELQVEPADFVEFPKRVVLIISDTGIGIHENEISRIFDRFYQVDDSTTRKEEGTGIGLALTQELVKLMQGTISVESKTYVGTSFRIQLPFTPVLADNSVIADLPQNASFMAVSPADNLANFGDEQDVRPLLLIVEDNPDLRFYLGECVRENYRVIAAENGRVGVEKARELVPDVIISDVMMPEMDGLTLCETLKNDELTSHIPIVLLTARADFESRISGLHRGADVYLAKPFVPEELLANLHNLVKMSQRMQLRYAAMVPPSHTEATDPAVEMEDAFLRKLRGVVEAHLADETFDVPDLGRALTMSRSQLFRKVKALTGASPSVAIRNIRLQKAKEFLQNPQLSVSEIAYEVGFSSPAYFSTVFSELFGKSPSDWRHS